MMFGRAHSILLCLIHGHELIEVVTMLGLKLVEVVMVLELDLDSIWTSSPIYVPIAGGKRRIFRMKSPTASGPPREMKEHPYSSLACCSAHWRSPCLKRL